MEKVLTIRDPRTGTLIAEEPIPPKEDEDSALARVYRKTLGPDAPEFMVMTRSVWPDDRKSCKEPDRDWGGYGLAVLSPKDDSKVEKSKLVLASISESRSAARIEFMMDRDELKAIRAGRRRDAVVPVKPSESLRVGDTVTFCEASYDPFGEVLRVSDGDSVSVVITELKYQDEWAGRQLYHIAWDPARLIASPKPKAARRPG